MKNLTVYVKKIIASLVFFGMAFSAQAETAVVVNSGNAGVTLSQADVANIFLGKAKNFPGGGAVTAIDQPEGSSLRDGFYSSVANKNAAQMNAYWSNLIFTGKGQPPEVGDDDEIVIELVSEDPEAIGYIDAASVTGDVKVVVTIP